MTVLGLNRFLILTYDIIKRLYFKRFLQTTSPEPLVQIKNFKCLDTWYLKMIIYAASCTNTIYRARGNLKPDKPDLTGPRRAVGNVSGYRCVSDCRSRGREFDPGPVPYFRGD